MPLRGVVRRFGTCSVLVMAMVLLASMALAQETPRAEIFGGYSWMKPGGPDATGLNPSMAQGWGAGATLFVNRILGISVDTGAEYERYFHIITFEVGPQFKFRGEKAEPFLEVLWVGLHRLSLQHLTNGAFPRGADYTGDNGDGLTFGGGIDIPVKRHLAIRLGRLDYMYGRHNFTTPGNQKVTPFNGVRFESGLVVRLGGAPPPRPPSLSATCLVQPTGVFDGEPVTVTATAQSIPKNHTVTYGFNATGGKLEAKDNVANVDTTGLTPGSYKVTATVTDPKAKKTPPATCDATYTVNERPKHPPTITCSSSATTVRAGEPVTFTCTTQNPDNRPLSYDWTASGGKLTPNQTSATLDTTGAPAGPINVATKVSDDRGLSASTSNTVNVEVPPPPPQAANINQIVFKAKSARVDNTAKAILDDVALRLQRDADAKAVIVGFWDPATEKRNGENLAAERAVNAKTYLATEKGIDPARVEVRTGTAGGTRAEIWMVPAGATFDAAGTSPVDETKVKPAKVVRHAPARRAKKAAPAKPAPKP